MPKVKQLKDTPTLDNYSVTKVVTMGNIIEVTSRKKNSFGCPCVKIDADHYCDLRTGELLQYSHIENRSQSLRSIKNTLSRVRSLVNTNITHPANVRWVTLTYRENMTDPKRLYTDFEKFWKRFLYWNQKNGFSKPEYLSVIEPQGRGAWHIHAFFIWNDTAPFIDNNSVTAQLWGHGFTKTKSVYDCDNVGAYFSAYLADMPVEDLDKLSEAEKLQAMEYCSITEKTFTDEQERSKTKQFLKGGRLYLYPPGMNIVRSSRGIKDPQIEVMSLQEAKEKVSSAKLTYSCAYEVLDDAGNSVNTLCKSYYNTNPRKLQ